MDKLTNEEILEALTRCIGANTIDREKGCEGCPLYLDHYCVDTLFSLIREKLEAAKER